MNWASGDNAITDKQSDGRVIRALAWFRVYWYMSGVNRGREWEPSPVLLDALDCETDVGSVRITLRPGFCSTPKVFLGKEVLVKMVEYWNL